MKILIDINHPAHVHYFKNFIKIMEDKGHEFILTVRDRGCTFRLLESSNIAFISRGKKKKGIGFLLYSISSVKDIYNACKNAHVDLFLDIGSIFSAPVSKMFNKPYVVFDDTEASTKARLLHMPFTDHILTPECFYKNLGEKQLRYKGYHELFYLHPKYFTPDSSILDILGVSQNEKFVILRFVSWDAHHDVGQSGLSLSMKHKLVKELSKYAKVFISSEGELPDDLKKYQIKIPPEKMHDALAFASLFVGEGATMASECACLGTPAIYVNSLEVGYCTEEEKKYNLVYGFRNSKGVLEKAIELLTTPGLKKEFQKRRKKMLLDKIDVTAFLIWFVENYPESVKIMKENPDYQNRFK